MEPSRRLLLGGVAAALGVRTLPASARKEQRIHLRTPEFDVRVAVTFHDLYASRGLWLREHQRDRRFCLSADGKEGTQCMSNFQGSLAIARYRVRLRTDPSGEATLREHVRTVDADFRLVWRPPVDRSIALLDGEASDLQAFGFEDVAGAESRAPVPANLWYLFRQDLFLGANKTPFVIVYWKHGLSAIRILDVIPGDQTSLLEK